MFWQRAAAMVRRSSVVFVGLLSRGTLRAVLHYLGSDRADFTNGGTKIGWTMGQATCTFCETFHGSKSANA